VRDLPTGPSLLALGRDVLINELLPLLPEEARLDARLVANSMAIAEREAVAVAGPADDIRLELRALYNEHGDEDELLRRFARDLRIGAFEEPPRNCQAHEILWRLTIAKLRLANPRFLTANGFD
jgi:Domain of unknown function (DUF6285)